MPKRGRPTNVVVGKQDRKLYSVFMDQADLLHLKNISKVEKDSVSFLIRSSVKEFIDKWHKRKKQGIIERNRDLNELHNQLNGWSSNTFDLGLKMEEVGEM